MKLHLVDSSIFVFKAWFAQKKAQNNLHGEPNHAFIGFSDFTYRLLTEVAPSKLVFAFDESLKQSSRKQIYPAYKANRSPAPLELKRQFGWCQQWVEYLGFSKAASQYWEADDLIGTLATLHRSAALPIVILTADKDLTQLIHEGDLWWSFYDDKKLDYRGIRKKFGVYPAQIADQLALMGDKVDNIPGIPCVGQKTAANLLRKFGSLQILRQNLGEVAKMKFRYATQVQQALTEHEAILDVSSRLTQINCAVPGVDKLSINRGAIQLEKLRYMMEMQAMDEPRRHKWESLLRKTEHG
ncbi:MAG: 5'-3' exonuclease [Gammaproteobacteria bacterium]|nr:5'-3' exonuclease [Gammaproteobacteria bacterium]